MTDEGFEFLKTDIRRLKDTGLNVHVLTDVDTPRRDAVLHGRPHLYLTRKNRVVLMKNMADRLSSMAEFATRDMFRPMLTKRELNRSSDMIAYISCTGKISMNRAIHRSELFHEFDYYLPFRGIRNGTAYFDVEVRTLDSWIFEHPFDGTKQLRIRDHHIDPQFSFINDWGTRIFDREKLNDTPTIKRGCIIHHIFEEMTLDVRADNLPSRYAEMPPPRPIEGPRCEVCHRILDVHACVVGVCDTCCRDEACPVNDECTHPLYKRVILGEN